MNRLPLPLLFVTLLALTSLSPVRAESVGGDSADIELATGARGGRLVIRFTPPLNPVGHSSGGEGRTLSILLHNPRPEEPVGSWSWAPDERHWIEQVQFTASVNGSGGNLVIRFRRTTPTRVLPDPAGGRLSILFGSRAKETAAVAPSTREEARLPSPVPPAEGEFRRVAELMEEARQAMVRKEWSRAIQLYTKVLRMPENPYTRDALEYLGLARERKGQLAHAKAEYRHYLERYPEGEGAGRVRQRLAAILTARKRPKAARGEPPSPSRLRWNSRGSFSQYYRRDQNNFNSDSNEVVTQSALYSDLDLHSRLRTDDYDLGGRVTAGYTNDFLDGGDNSGARVSYLYLEGSDADHRLKLRAGRQNSSSGGVMGRFDGLWGGWRINQRTRLTAVTGLPVRSTEEGPDSERLFLGTSVELSTSGKAWGTTGYLFHQQVAGVTDRQAVGLELRYLRDGRSLFGLLDYDTSFNRLNIFMLFGNWSLPGRTSFHWRYDRRTSPMLTLGNALIGQGDVTMDTFLRSHSEEETRQLALDRTSVTTSGSAGLSRPLTDRFTLSGDLTVTRTTATVTSGGVEGIPATGPDLFLSLQLIGSDLLVDGDSTLLGMRYSDTDSADTLSLSVNSRFPLGRGLRINPRLRLDLRDNRVDDGAQITLSPSVRLDYRFARRQQVEAEVGGEWSNLQLSDAVQDNHMYWFHLGYRLSF